MFEIKTASRTEGTSVLEITEMAGVFSPTEVECVQELWDAYQEGGEDSGYVFLVCRNEDG